MVENQEALSAEQTQGSEPPSDVDLSFVDKDPPPKRSLQEHFRDVLRECLRHRLSRLQDDGEQAVEYAKDLIRAGGDVSEELKELEAFGHSAVLMAGMLRREASKGE